MFEPGGFATSFDILITPISNLMNICPTHRVFPDQFKTAVVSPLLKKSTLDKEDMKHYCPVSDLNLFTEVLE